MEYKAGQLLFFRPHDRLARGGMTTMFVKVTGVDERGKARGTYYEETEEGSLVFLEQSGTLTEIIPSKGETNEG